MDSLLLHQPSLLAFFIMFLLLYLFAYFVVFRNWSPKHRAEASSCFMSLAHGTPAILMTIQAFLRAQDSSSFAAPNSPLHNRVLEFSLAYFLMDLLHYMVFFPHDILFILHHVATLYVVGTCRYVVHHGAYGILVLLIIAEVTSFCQNVWSLACMRKDDVPAAAALFKFLSPPFYAFYSVVRGVLGPTYVVKLVLFYLSGEANGLIPSWAWISWMMIIGTAILVSILWVSNNWTIWYKERSSQAKRKVN